MVDEINFQKEKNHMLVPTNVMLYRSLKQIKLLTGDRPVLWRLKRISKFLLNKVPLIEKPYPTMKNQTRKYLRSIFQNSVGELSTFLKQDLSKIWF